MAPYLIITAAIAVIAILYPQRRPHPYAWAMAFIVLVIFVGLRHKVGMDWNNYLIMESRIRLGSLREAFKYAEPGYATLLWVSSQIGMGVYGANLVGSLVFCLGLFRYALTTSSPWLALTTAMPFLVIVVAMSANRQAIAVGILLWLVATWGTSSIVRRIFLISTAAMFHFSAVFLLLFVAFDLRMRRGYKILLSVVAIAMMLGFMHFSGGADRYDNLYLAGQSEITYSPGAQLHVLLNGLPAAFLFLGRRAREKLFPTPLQRQMALLALALIPLAVVASTAAGRMSFYLFPVSIFVFSMLPKLVHGAAGRTFMRIFLAGLLFGLSWLWLAHANSSQAHKPYRNALFMDTSSLHLPNN